MKLNSFAELKNIFSQETIATEEKVKQDAPLLLHPQHPIIKQQPMLQAFNPVQTNGGFVGG